MSEIGKTTPNFALPWTIANTHREHVDIVDARGKSVFEQIRPDYAALIVKAVNEFATQGWIVGNGDGTKWRHWTDCGPEWVTDRNSATRFARREDAEAVHAADEDAWTVERFCNAPTGFEKLLKAAEAIKQMKFDRYKKRNGHETGIEADDGEKCWIVHSDQISALEFAIKEARSSLGEARVSDAQGER
jgi:hypothetical protein